LERGEKTLPAFPQATTATRAVTRLWQAAENEVLSEKIVHDCQLAWQSDLERLRSLARLGPALGLMGTLIPLGPALVGLAAGDLEMMSQNLMIAFATTVVGLLAGSLATLLASTKKQWYQRDHAVVDFVARRLPQLRAAHPAHPRLPAAPCNLTAADDGLEATDEDLESICAKETSHA
jgi:biopolymer transport protein ExbB/TolQ